MSESCRRLAERLGLTGNWTTVTRAALLSNGSGLPMSNWFLCWSRYAIIWSDWNEGVFWVSAHHLAPTTVQPGSDIIRHQWVTAFRALQEFPSRQALLHLVGFDLWGGWYELMEVVPTRVGAWRWNE